MSWRGVDLDGTLAFHDGWRGPAHIGAPIAPMVRRVQQWIRDGEEVRIFTARCYPLYFVPSSYSPAWTPGDYEQLIAKLAIEAIREWCKTHIGLYLSITCVKDYEMYQIWDDRAVQVEQNTGRRMDNEPEGVMTP